MVSPGSAAAVDAVVVRRLAAAAASGKVAAPEAAAPPAPPASKVVSAFGRVAASFSWVSGLAGVGWVAVVVVVEAEELPMAASAPGSLDSPGVAASPGRPAVVAVVVVEVAVVESRM